MTELMRAPEPNRASVPGMAAFPDRIAGLDARFVGRAPDRATICGVDARNRRPDAVFGDEVPFDVARWERHQVARADSPGCRSRMDHGAPHWPVDTPDRDAGCPQPQRSSGTSTPQRPRVAGMRNPKPWQLPTEPARGVDLLAGCVTHSMLETQLRRGRLLRVRPGVYLDADHWPEDERGRHLSRAHAELAAFPDGAISHGSAGLIWGLYEPFFTNWAADLPSITLPSQGRYRSRSRHAHHRVTALPSHHVTRDANGYAVTSIARTAVDLVRDLDLPQALIVLDSAARRLIEAMVVQPRRRDYADPRLRRAAIETIGKVAGETRSHRAVRRVLPSVDPRRESPTESASVGHMYLAGLPIPQCQYLVVVNGQVFYLDFYWEDLGVIGEVDGATKYAGEQGIIDEKEREQVLRDTGAGMVRWLGKEIAVRPDDVMDRVRRALAAAQSRL